MVLYRIITFIMALFMYLFGLIGAFFTGDLWRSGDPIPPSGPGGSGGSHESKPVVPGGLSREARLSREYQSGIWDGRAKGIPRAEVIDGLLYVGGKESDYPADSSEPYLNDRPIISVYGGTWFRHSMDTRSLKIRLDYRGRNLQTYDFTKELVGAEAWHIDLSEGHGEILLGYTKDSRSWVIRIPVSPGIYTAAGFDHDAKPQPAEVFPDDAA